MKYLMIGAGGTGGCVGGFLAQAGKDVTLIARGSHKAAIEQEGLMIDSGLKGELHIQRIKVCEAADYHEQADVIFVCVKGYSLEEVIPLIKKAAHQETVVIPLLNLYGTGGRLAKALPELQILDACIYIVGYISAPGHLVQSGKIFKIVYGPREGQIVDTKVLEQLQQELEVSGIRVIYSQDIRKDTFQKFSFISSYAACGAYYDVEASAMQQEGVVRQLLGELQWEIKEVGEAMGIRFEEDLTAINMRIVDALAPDTTASMQKDLRSGKAAEVDGLVTEVVRMGLAYGVSTPCYDKVRSKLIG